MPRGWAIIPSGDYPPAWVSGEIQREMYAHANWTCEHCGMKFIKGSTIAKTAKQRNGKPFILTIHHLNGDKADCRYENLLACCNKCHLHIQAVWQPGDPLPLSWHNAAPDWLIKRGLPFLENPQIALFSL